MATKKRTPVISRASATARKVKPIWEMVRTRPGKSEPEFDDYEPPTRPLSKLGAREVFLRLLANERPEILSELFDNCYPAFRQLKQHPVKPISKDDAEDTEAELFTFGIDEFSKYQMKGSVESMQEVLDMELDTLKFLKEFERPNTEYQDKKIAELKLVLGDMQMLHEGLNGWRSSCHMQGSKTDWFCDFGISVLRGYWDANARRLTALEQRSDLPQWTYEKPAAADAKVVTRNAVPLVRESSLEKPAVLTAADVFERQRLAWSAAVHKYSEKLKTEMQSPVEEGGNAYTRAFPLPFGGMIGGKWLKPEDRLIQPPKPPEGLPAIADDFEHYRVPTCWGYQRRVLFEVEQAIENSPMQFLSAERKSRLISDSFNSCFPALSQYWIVFGKHLKKCGWIEVSKKEQLETHSKWLLANLKGRTHGGIAQTAKTSRANVTQRIKEMKQLLGLLDTRSKVT